MIIDWHTHVHPPKEAARPLWQGKCPATIENVLNLHDEADLDISVISSAGHYLRNFSREEAVPVVRESNEYMASLRDRHQDKIVALATNAVAAKAMQQAGAWPIGVGTEAIAQTVPTVDVIVTSLNLVLPGSMLGEVTPDIVQAILTARAKKVLLPVNRAYVEVVGTEDQTLDSLIARSLFRVTSFVGSTRQV